MTETTTLSVEGDRLEAIARLVDPETWADFDAVSALNLAYPYSGRKQLEASIAKARQIAALPCEGGEAKPFLHIDDINDPVLRGLANLEDGQCWMCLTKNGLHAPGCSNATPTTEPDTGRGLRADVENEARRLYIAHVDGAGIHCNRFPSWGEMSDDSKKRWRAQALAALSDTPSGREEEGKQGLMASRDLGPTTVASSLKGSDVGEVKP